MKYLLLIPFFSFAQFDKKINNFIEQHDDAAHIYATMLVTDISYHTQELLLPKQKIVNRVLLAEATGLTAGILKEVNDKYRCNRNKRTGFSYMDLAFDTWGLAIYTIVRICVNDYKNNRIIDRNYRKHILD